VHDSRMRGHFVADQRLETRILQETVVVRKNTYIGHA
jgi:hypothetical protein